MFDRKNQYYVTKGVQEVLSYQLQYFCGQLIFQRAIDNELTMDYLQIIEFDVDTEHELLAVFYC